MGGGNQAIGGLVDQARRKHHGKIHPQALPLDFAPIGDLGGDVAPEDIHRQCVARLKVKGIADVRTDRYQRFGGIIIIRRPPIAAHQFGFGRRYGSKGQPTIPAQEPAIIARSDIFGFNAINRRHTPAQHRCLFDIRNIILCQKLGAERLNLVRLNIKEEERRGRFGQVLINLVVKVALDPRNGHQKCQAQPKRQGDGNRAGPRSMQVGERQP